MCGARRVEMVAMVAGRMQKGVCAWAVGVVAAVALAGCLAGPAAGPGVAPTADDSIRFLVIGDPGTGDEAQHRVAAAMQTVCEERGCAFVLVNGDNIYETGVDGPRDAQFDDKFEAPYAAFDIPFWLVLGNHDNGGGGTGTEPDRGDHQVAYAKRDDRASDKWHMPARYYTFRAGAVEFFAIDSGPASVSMNPIWLPGGPGPMQQAWLTDALADSTADWKVAFAHHPYVSNGMHGDAGTYDDIPAQGLAYKQMLQDTVCGEVDLLLAGHDHDLQWLQPVAACGATEFIVSGAAAKTRERGAAPHHPARFEAYGTHGFVWVQVAGDRFTAAFYDDQARLLYEASTGRAR